jgi:hypothetical protein
MGTIFGGLLFLSIFKNHEKNKEIEQLKQEITKLNDDMPCYSPCFICKITNKPCVGKKRCKIACGVVK